MRIPLVIIGIGLLLATLAGKLYLHNRMLYLRNEEQIVLKRYLLAKQEFYSLYGQYKEYTDPHRIRSIGVSQHKMRPANLQNILNLHSILISQEQS